MVAFLMRLGPLAHLEDRTCFSLHQTSLLFHNVSLVRLVFPLLQSSSTSCQDRKFW